RTRAALSWNASTDDVSVVSCNRHRAGDRVADATTTSAKIDGLACGRNYTFSVEAVDAAGNHSGRATLTVSTSACPPPPTPRPGPDRQPPSKPTGLSATSV